MRHALTATLSREEFRASRQFLGLTAREFAALWGVSARTVSGWETGQRDGKPCALPFAAGLFMRMLIRFEPVRRALGLRLKDEL